MRLLIVMAALLLLAAAEPALAQSTRPLEIAQAQLGMRLNQLRFASLPANAKLICGKDQDKPPGAEHTHLILPGAMQAAGVDRCAIFLEEGKNKWVVRPVNLAGVQTEFWFMTIEDEAGIQRIFQIVARQPKDNFDKTAAFLTERWGAPAQKVSYFIRWLNGTNEGQMKEDDEGVMIFLFDTKLFALMESRMPKGKPKK
ncbi:hypothetical protein A6A04_01340 [Paramagnetospirillum marisnigri]|uniref:Uncharacterized protein n=1 Tax=Paramagnetospirillum marisnigri TaxID=1285242 RepID=A0A178MSW6_9PROT|nr:hypothetical protein [Paramagnetospirillum marisnigri]OAN52362.1 hypothetical protein A6A04_01340 [Paramagnetospirillum marisnigri]